MVTLVLPPACLRCGKPCHKVSIPSHLDDELWVWGHDCDPWEELVSDTPEPVFSAPPPFPKKPRWWQVWRRLEDFIGRKFGGM